MTLSDTPWHALDPSDVARRLETDLESGLSPESASARLLTHGPNALAEIGRQRWWHILGRQFLSPLILILAVGAAISVAVGHAGDALTILAIVILNAVLGFVQEWRAEQALAALKKMLSPHARVVRGGRTVDIDGRDLVPGDMVEVNTGDRVPADLRIAAATNFRTDEAPLTGESMPVSKTPETVAGDASLSDRRGMAYMGTVAVNGRALGIVVATAMATELGRIAMLTRSVERETTPLQHRLARLGRLLAGLGVTVSSLIALVGWLGGKPASEMLMTGISLTVAVVPEGLPAIVTITLALGMRTLIGRRTLVRRLQAAETLGNATFICTDKTGTLTQGEMTVTRIWLAAGAVEVTGVGYDPAGHFETGGAKLDYRTRPDLLSLLTTGLTCSHATIESDEHGWRLLGEPTEGALVVAGYKAWLPAGRSDVVNELSFDSTRKRMAIITRTDGRLTAHVKGAPEVIAVRCSRVLDGDEVRDLTPDDRDRFRRAVQAMTGNGLRVLALARRDLDDDTPMTEDDIESDLVLLGFAGIIDPPRPEVPAAVATAARAGISVIMITGDAGDTGLAVARQIGLRAPGYVTGTELDSMSLDELQAALGAGMVFARTTPEHKMRIVEALQRGGEVCAMTGDGVNDAPSLKEADVGIAMGIRGTDAARGAADMVLTDDNFASIVGAVEEGRRQSDNIAKFIGYLLSSNLAEVTAIGASILMGGPLMLLPVQILWMNLITDGVTALALGVEPAEADVMSRPPRRVGDGPFSRRSLVPAFVLGAYMAVATVVLFQVYLPDGDPASIAIAQTMAFTGIIVFEKVNVFNFRSLAASLLRTSPWSNPWLIAAVISMLGLQALAVYTPFLQVALHTAALEVGDWLLIAALALPIPLIGEALKRMRFGRVR